MKKLLVLTTLFFSVSAMAQEAAHAAGGGDKGLIAIGAGILLGLAALGGTFGQGKIGASAMEGIARNPQAGKAIFMPMILCLVFVESLVIFSFVIAFMIQNKV
jgi:F-type H+-transporting ATPase subunit c